MIEKVDPSQRLDFVNQTGDPMFVKFTGRTALHWAAMVNNAEMVELLIGQGANKEAQDVEVGDFQTNKYIFKHKNEIKIIFF